MYRQVTLYLFSVIILPSSLLADDTPGWFTKLHRDNDGRLDATEAGRFLDAMDVNKDQVVSLSEALDFAKSRARNAARVRRDIPAFKAEDFARRKKTGKGLWVVSIGHSCVISAITSCVKASLSGGFENHNHLMQFFGGPGGAARRQWERMGDQQQAKPALASGKVDVLTFGHLIGPNGESFGCDVEDYRKWMDLALKDNPDIRFYIQDLWPWLSGPSGLWDQNAFDLEEYKTAMVEADKSLATVVNHLRREYPGRVDVIPIGAAMVELVERASKGNLPGVDEIMVPAKDSKMRVGLYRDMIHSTDVSSALQGYIWYACLYGKNPVELKSGIYEDETLDGILRELAWKTVTSHSLSSIR